jgi:hypothetical protein
MKRTLLVAAVTFVALTRCAAVTPPGWGCFVDRWQLKHPAQWDRYCRHMASVGMNTFAFYPKSEADLIDQIETGLREGLLRKDVPVILVSNMPGSRKGLSNEDEWAEMPGRVAKCRTCAPHGNDWPTIYLYGTDEPIHAEQCVQWSCSYRTFGAKPLTSICYPNVPDFLPYLDGILIHASPGVLTADNVAATRRAGVLFGVYNIGMRRVQPGLMRYWTGAWTYAAGCKLNLLWWYPTVIWDRPNGPVSRQSLVGYKQGVADWYRLDALHAKLPPVDWDFWPGMTGSLGPEVQAEWKRDWIAYGRRCPVPALPEVLR